MIARALATGALCVAAVGCAAEAPAHDDGSSCDQLVAGDLVITEVLADPEGVDDGLEWIEIYGAAAHPLDLTGVTIVHARPDGSRDKRVSLAGGTIEPGAYHVLGSAPADALPAHMDDGYSDRLGELFNSGGGRIALLCGASQVDEVIYGDAHTGRSWQLDGSTAPDYTLNDERLRWCDAGDGSDGTPGDPNAPCAVDPALTCEDGGVRRAVVLPAPGDVVISEVMPNPAGPDGVAEWVELVVHRAVDLNGLVLGRDAADPSRGRPIVDTRCVSVSPGGYALIARSGDGAKNGGLPVPAAIVDLTLGNSDASFYVANGDGVILDAVSWPTSRDGVSIQIATDALSPDGNDDVARRCAATDEYGPGGRGTPGASNDCGLCRDGDTLRPIVSPRLLDLEIAEWMANPEGLASDRGEYVELRATVAVDLNGLQIGRTAQALEAPLASPRCLHVEAGASAVLAHAGSDIADADGNFAFALVQTQGSLVIAHGGEIVDEVSYDTSTAGRATIVDERGRRCTIAADAAYRYNGIDYGTPRQPNPRCP